MVDTPETPKEVKLKPTVTLETDTRAYVLEGDKAKIEDTAFQMRVLKSFEFSTLGGFSFEDAKVTVKNK